MNWGTFKGLVEDQGVKDEDEIFYIDISGFGADEKEPEIMVSKEKTGLQISC